MRRTQIYLPEEMWQALHAQAVTSGTTISELMRQAVQKQFMVKSGRKEAMMGIIGMWKDRADLPDTETYIRSLRKNTRMERIFGDTNSG